MTAGRRGQPARSLARWLSALCVVLASCADRAALRDAVGQAEDTGSYGIEWYAGSVDSAFELARSQGTPVLLYWGADWCPPCNRLKATVFNRREFIERTRLFVPVSLDGDAPGAQKLGEQTNSGDEDPTLPVEERPAAQAWMLEILQDPALAAAVQHYVVYGAHWLLPMIAQPDDAGRADLESKWEAAIERIRNAPETSPAHRVATYFGEICLIRARQPEEALPASLVREARGAVMSAARNTVDPYARLALFSSAWLVLAQVGNDGWTWGYVMDEAEDSHAPDYVMSVLAASYENKQTTDMALYWRQRAWKAATGPATRFGRGTRYVQALLSLTPHNARVIEQITIKIFRELNDEPDAFFHGVTRAMERLETALHEWNAEGAHDDSLAKIRAEVLEVCTTTPAGDQSRTNCEAFLASLDG